MSSTPKAPTLKITSNGELFQQAEAGQTFPESDFRFGTLLDQHLAKNMGRPVEGRKVGVYSPSGLYGCARKIYYNRIGAPKTVHTPPRKQLIFAVGHAIHDMLNNYVRQMFGVAEAAYEVEVEWLNTGLHGEADLLIFQKLDGKVTHIVDFKTISNDSFQDLAPPRVRGGKVTPQSMSRYVWQLHSYMLATNCPNASLFYLNKNDQTHIEYPVSYNHDIGTKIVERIMATEQAISLGEMPEQEINGFCRECEFLTICQPAGITLPAYCYQGTDSDEVK